MKKILLVGCGSEIGSNLLLLSKRYDFKFDITTVINSPIKLDNKFEKLDQAQKINTLSMIAPITNEEKQKLLESISLESKIRTLESIFSFYLYETNLNNHTIQ